MYRKENKNQYNLNKMYKFEENIWISFENNEISAVGRTIVIGGDYYVASVDVNGNIGHIPFELIKNPKKIKFSKELTMGVNTHKENKEQLPKYIRDEKNIISTDSLFYNIGFSIN